MLIKLGLSINFPRIVMHETCNMLGLVFMKLRTKIAAQILKMHLANVRLSANTSTLMKLLQEYDAVEPGIENKGVKRNLKPCWTEILINKVKEECNKRKIRIANNRKKEVRLSKMSY